MLLLIFVLAVFLINFATYEKSANILPKPWHIERNNDGSSNVFGFIPGKDKVLEAIKKLPENTSFALIKNTDQARELKLEAYAEKVNLSGVIGKLVLVFSSIGDFGKIRIWSDQNQVKLNDKEKFVKLTKDQLGELGFLTLNSITLVPDTNLSEDKLLQTFGPPKEKITDSQGTLHFLYPKLGVDAALNAKAKDIIQYVSPKEFYKVRDPLN